MENKLKPVLTIIIATFNAAKEIGPCISSILGCNLPDVEVVIIDGASNDGTIETALTYLDKINLKYISEPDAGIYDALNKGINIAAGKWIHFLGSDDRLLPGFRKMVDALRNEDTIYYGNSISVHETNHLKRDVLLKGEFSLYRIAKYCINHQSIIYPAKVFSIYKYELKYKVFADYALNLKVWGDDRFTKTYLPIDMVAYNMTGFSTQNKDVLFMKEKGMIVNKSMGLKIYLRYLFRSLKDRILKIDRG